MALTVTLSGTTTIEQGESTTLTATVTDANGNAVEGATVDFSAPQGSFSDASVDTDSNGEASTDWTADFTDTDDVDVVITASAILAANPNPTVSAPSLTALSELGITGIVANLYITSTGEISSFQNEVYREGSVGTAHPSSDPDITSELAINRIRWNVGNFRLALNRAGTEAWNVWDDTNQNASVYAIAPDGTHLELPIAEEDAIGSGFIRWNIDTSLVDENAFAIAMNAIDAGDQFVVGVGDSDSIGFPEDTGSNTVTVTAEAQMVTLVATTLEIVSGNNQSAEVGMALANELVARVLDQNGDPFTGATVNFAVSPTDGVLSATSGTTDNNGRVSTQLTLGSMVGDYVITVSVTGLADVAFTVSATAASPPPQPQSEAAPKLLIFKKQLNRTTIPAAAGDNDYSTYTDNSTVTILIDQDGDAQAFDTLFLKMMNVTSYVIEVDGVALPTRTVPDNLTGISELGDVSILRHGYQHDLYELSAAQSGSTVEITFSGSNIRVSEVWVLKKIAALQKLKKIAHSQIDRDSEPQNNLYGYEETDVITGLDRLRWQSDIELEFTHTDENYEVFLDIIEDHAEEGIVVAQEPRRLPQRVYQAIFSKLSHAAPYLTTYRPAGNTIQFLIDEIRAAAPLWYSMDTFNTNDSGDGLMFFTPCAHLFENGAVDDNDYKTFSTQTTHTFNVEAVSHIFVKCSGVTSYQVQTNVSNTWTTQETITPTQKAYRGYDNSLTQLTTRIVDDQVRLVFTGSNIEIYEVMCLDLGGEILTDTQSLLTKTDRTGIIHEGQGGVLKRSRIRASQRMKWEIGVRATFGHFDDFVVDDVFDWINAYPNFVFSYLPNEYPWRTFPATWTDTQFQQAFLTTVLQHGDYLQMNVKER